MFTGTVKDGDLKRPVVHWFDGKHNGAIAKKYLRTCPVVVQEVGNLDGERYRIVEYNGKGVVVEKLGTRPSPRKAAAQRVSPRKQQRISKQRRDVKRRRLNNKTTDTPKRQQNKKSSPKKVKKKGAESASQKKGAESASQKKKKNKRAQASGKKKGAEQAASQNKKEAKGAETASQKRKRKASVVPWLKCTAPDLADTEYMELDNAIDDLKIDCKTDTNYYNFLARVCRHFKDFVAKDASTNDSIYARRDAVVSSCIDDVYTQIKPSRSRPLGGQTAKAVKVVLPVIEYVFEIDPAGERYGSPEWIDDLLKHPSRITIAQAAKHEPLRIRLVKHWIAKACGKHGYPKKPDGY